MAAPILLLPARDALQVDRVPLRHRIAHLRDCALGPKLAERHEPNAHDPANGVHEHVEGFHGVPHSTTTFRVAFFFAAFFAAFFLGAAFTSFTDFGA